MFCSKCGNQIKRGEKFCGKCGAPVSVKQPIPQPKTQSVEQTVNLPTVKKHTDKKMIFIILTVVVCVVVLIGTICPIVLYINNSDPVGGDDDIYYNSGENSSYYEFDPDVYRGRGFTIKAEGYGFDGGIDDSYDDNHYWAFLTNDYNSEIEIFVYESLNPESELEDEYGDLAEFGEKNNIGGATAYVYDDGEFVSITAYSNKYIYYIYCEGDYEGVQNAYDIILNSFKVTEYEYYQIAEDVYQGRGFILEASGYDFDGGIDDSYGDNLYWAYITNDTSEIEMNVLESDNPKAEVETEITDYADFGKKTNLGGATAYVDETIWDDGSIMISIFAYSDKYIYCIECEGEDAQSEYDMLVNNFKITD